MSSGMLSTKHVYNLALDNVQGLIWHKTNQAAGKKHTFGNGRLKVVGAVATSRDSVGFYW